MTCLARVALLCLSEPLMRSILGKRSSHFPISSIRHLLSPISYPRPNMISARQDARDLQLLLSAGRTIQPIGDTDSFGDSVTHIELGLSFDISTSCRS
jgi:hypothetical protein